MDKFKLVSKFKPMGDQPQAIEKLVQGIKNGEKPQVLKGGYRKWKNRGIFKFNQ